MTVDGTYLFPTLRSYQIFSDPGSRLDSHWLVKSLRTRVQVRPSDRLEIAATYLVGRSRYDSAFPNGSGTSVNETADTDLIEVNGLWLSQPDRESRPRRADLDGLSGPLLRRHRTRVDWEGMWRRYGSTQASQEPDRSSLFQEVRSTDLRLGVGVGYGLDDRLEVSGDSYWQPAFTVGDSGFFQAHGVSGRIEDRSRRLSAVFGAQVNARWRPSGGLEAFAGTTWEHQAVTVGDESAAQSTDIHHQLRLRTGATWLSRPPDVSAVLRPDLDGLYHPLLEKHQLRLDADLRLRRSGGDDATDGFEETAWRVQGAVGIWSFLQAGVYAGRFREGPIFGSGLFQAGPSFGWTVTLRPARQVEGYASFNCHPKASIGDYPAFNLQRGSFFQSFYDVTNTGHEDDASLHLGLRLAF